MTTATAVAAPDIAHRSTFVFSDNGRYGACLRARAADLTLESWTLTSEQPRCQSVSDPAISEETRLLPLDDGRILVFHTGGAAARHELALLHPHDGRVALQRLGAIPAPWGGHLLPSPNSDQLGFAVALDDAEHSTIWRLPASGAAPEPLMQVPGALTGGVWLDDAALVLGINQTCDGSRCSGITVDLLQGSWRRVWSVSDTSSDQILLYSPHSKLLIVSSNVSGRPRLGWAHLGEPTVHFPETLHRAGYVRHALALDDRGERLLVHEVAGASSRLLIHTPVPDGIETLPTPPGTISAPASWAGEAIRFRFSAPSHPPTLATVRLPSLCSPGSQPQWSASHGHEFDIRLGEAPAELIEVEGPTGPIEAIVYGGSDWRQCEHLVVALHGGPLSSWRFEFEPLFHSLSTHGVAVLAPNYRGSTGYGEDHLRAVVGHWGGPDLDDVLHLARSLGQDRGSRQLPGPVVLGVSYGAFLALLAACQEPALWSGCVAVAPFLSAASFHDSATDAVQARIEQLGGMRQSEDAIGPRDVLRACVELAAPLLLMHGVEDETIPVEQSRMLRQRLLELDRTEGVDFEYVEIDTDHAGLVRAQPRELIQLVVRFCLTRS